MTEKSKNKQILFLHDNVTNGGGEKMFRWLGQNLKNKGYNVHFLFMYDNPLIDISMLEADCIGLTISQSYLPRNIKYFTIGTYKLFCYLKKNKTKYVVSFGTNSFYLLGLFKYFFGFKIIVAERADPQYKRFGWLRKYLFSKAEYSVFQTQGARNFFSLNKDSQSIIIPNPVKIPNMAWKDDNANNVIVSVGRLDLVHKRQDVLLKAFAKVHHLYPDYQLQLVGSGGDRERIQTLVTELKLDDSVILTGQVSDVNSKLINARVFALTSDFEGIPNALLEAMALGMPVVSTDCSPGGAAFLIGKNEYGLLVERGDFQGVAEAIIKYLNSNDLRVNYGEKARSYVMQYSDENIIKKWMSVVNNFLS